MYQEIYDKVRHYTSIERLTIGDMVEHKIHYYKALVLYDPEEFTKGYALIQLPDNEETFFFGIILDGVMPLKIRVQALDRLKNINFIKQGRVIIKKEIETRKVRKNLISA